MDLKGKLGLSAWRWIFVSIPLFACNTNTAS
jgi:hypothetical protein